MAVVAGVDSSTQSTKVELRDADTGALIGAGRAPHPATNPPRSEQDPESWWTALGAAWADALADAGQPTGDRTAPPAPSRRITPSVKAVSVAAQQHGLVLADADLRPLRPAKLWNDTESAAEAAQLVEALTAERWATLTGSVPTASFTVAKLAWVAAHEPEVLSRSRRVLLPHDWLTARLSGALVTDRGDASGTGYWSPAEGRYVDEILHLATGEAVPAADWAEALPRVLGPSDPAGSPTPDALAALDGSTAGTIIGPGTGDNMAAALGLGLRPGDIAISLGTSGTAFAVSASPTSDASGAVAGFADATGRFLPLVCTLNCTKVTDTFAALLGVEPPAFERLALEAPPGSGGLVLVPYLDGERTPNRPHATGMLAGLRSGATREEIARAAVEGVICGLLDGVAALEHAGVPTGGRVYLVGGGARSRAFQQVCADVIGREVVVAPTDVEWVAAGAAVQAAAVGLGAAPDDVAAAWHLTAGARTVEPVPGADGRAVRDAYAEACQLAN